MIKLKDNLAYEFLFFLYRLFKTGKGRRECEKMHNSI